MTWKEQNYDQWELNNWHFHIKQFQVMLNPIKSCSNESYTHIAIFIYLYYMVLHTCKILGFRLYFFMTLHILNNQPLNPGHATSLNRSVAGEAFAQWMLPLSWIPDLTQFLLFGLLVWCRSRSPPQNPHCDHGDFCETWERTQESWRWVAGTWLGFYLQLCRWCLLR
jgi:succinate dehydrogenase/fumarate reductase cytochrome b subunit